MRPTGPLHLGHYHGVLKNWIQLQYQYECFFFVADWHALTTHYEDPIDIEENVWETFIDWLACGINPGSCKLFIQSRVPEHAELHLLLSMLTPLGWLERVPTYKDQQEKLREKDLATYGFLGYPLLQSADILAYKAGFVPVGEDQVSHLELTREVARRFNHLYGKEKGFEEKSLAAAAKMGKKNAAIYLECAKQYRETGNVEALERGKALVSSQGNVSLGDRERLYGYLEGTGKIILPEPYPLLSQHPKLPGLDGQKMSKSYGNTIAIREAPENIEKKIRVMPTDPARVRRTDPGDPEKCPVWSLHKVYSSEETKNWVMQGCTTAGIGCLECKKAVSDAIVEHLRPIQERAMEYKNNMPLVKEIVREGCEAARDLAEETLEEVREVMGLVHRER
ncbi:MAG: tryptophan--tRNA ligase [Gammaproteobacteria bacterium 39-13]|nr:tryptophan--tRNA ligase [Gammaproteobacteria bacterium]OJV94388.1 MAG: tryptophan--tRNA ligase [Gammaproteobacteria bacterium 39-13]